MSSPIESIFGQIGAESDAIWMVEFDDIQISVKSTDHKVGARDTSSTESGFECVYPCHVKNFHAHIDVAISSIDISCP